MTKTVFILSAMLCCFAHADALDLPPIETLVIEPVHVENIHIWVPASKSGPFINRACQPRYGQTYSFSLSSSVQHTKADNCPGQVARLLAENVYFYHSQAIPLTIFDGWHWEYIYDLSQFKTVSYDLAERGGFWETCWEATLNISIGHIRLLKLEVESLQEFTVQEAQRRESSIKVKTFSSMRTRDGYPKNAQL